MIEPLRFDDSGLVLLDQRLLPNEERYITLTSPPDVVEAIRTMVVRGAPAIGITGAYGVALAARRHAHEPAPALVDRLREAATALAQARPTAVNLAWAVHRVMDAALQAFADDLSSEAIRERVIAEARAIHEEDLAANHAMGSYGAAFVPDGARVLTHCNAGALATSGFGTALGVVRSAVLEGKSVAVFADETRPFLQGARLTAWELHRDNIPVSVITDGMAGALMAKGEIDLVVVGADRIARNGDVANKIGTYTVAVLARRHGIPFYVAAPTSTLDIACPSGSEIPIEERADEEVTHVFGVRVTPEGVAVRNPAFDVTPAELVTAIITESGVARAPYERSLAALLGLATDDAALTETAALEIEAIGNGAAPPEASAELGDDHDHEGDSDAS